MWIDALCIIQDDDQDWQEQAAQMASIYESAYVTIAATKSLDSASGFLSERNGDGTLTYYEKQHKTFTVFVRRSIEHSWLSRDPKPNAPYPLMNRAWCFQERLLGTRVLHFTGPEVVFQCNSCNRCECGSLTDNYTNGNAYSGIRSVYMGLSRNVLHFPWND